MNVMQKLLTALRSSARELGDAIIDANSTRIFEQEITEAEQHLQEAKVELTTLLAKQLQSEDELQKVQLDIKKHENYVKEALNNQNESLALEIAEKIAALESEHNQVKQTVVDYQSNTNQLKVLIQKTERQLRDYQRQLAMVKTTEKVQQTTSTISANFSAGNSKLITAKETLDRIAKQQEEEKYKQQAADQLANESEDKQLEKKLTEAGIIKNNRAEDILEKIKQSQQND
ncbi:PspA/IM30 family protein [Zooshikella marina]|uniref:PspA/IM30 family protein n=1 Tax=Zooshikella ganghwensis TaxID=202772 RepID=A0A4P9VQE1_9GAMM|nr:PspA/IM30 family protein [Zooshikella ganghwensis]MBU2708015.1 PspA/IM30 family protein [Zooshikella ganghwensis]RDH45755.1 PspA/IM30 family protein [Zooshikella ganghwensis]